MDTNVSNLRLSAGDLAVLPDLNIITKTDDYELEEFLPQWGLGFHREDWLRAYDGILVINGRGATGKTKLIQAMTDTYPDRFEYVAVHTTRRLRDGEKQGIDIVSVDDSEFDSRRKKNKYIVTYWVGHKKRRKRSALPLEPVKQALRSGKIVVTVLPAPVADFLSYLFAHVYRVCLNPSPEDHREYQRFRGLSPDDSDGQNYAGFISDEPYVMPGMIEISNEMWKLYEEIRQRKRQQEESRARILYEMVVEIPRLFQILSDEHPEVVEYLSSVG